MPSLAPPLLVALLALGAGDTTPIEVVIPQRSEPVSYAREVAEVLADKCLGCHSSALAENGLSLEDVAGMKKGGERGPALVPGKADESLLFTLAAHRADPAMPPKDKKAAKPLTPEQLGVLKLWIDAGAVDDSDEAADLVVELGTLPPGVHPIAAVDLTADGRLLAAGRANGVQLFDAETGREIIALGGHQDIIQSLRFSPDGKRLAAGSYRIVTVWDVPASGDAWGSPRVLTPHAGRVLAIDFSPDGRLLAAGAGDPSRSGEVKVWDLTDGTPKLELPTIHSDTVFALRFSPDGTRLATASADKFVKVVNLADGKEVRSLEGHTSHVMALDWKADGKELVSGGADNVLKLWDVEAGEARRALQGAGKQVTSLRWVAGKPMVVGASGDRMVRSWNPENGGVVRSFPGAADYVLGVAVSADGSRIAAGDAEGVLFLWNGENGQLLHKLSPKVGAAP
jgi:WD40 repeat protein